MSYNLPVDAEPNNAGVNVVYVVAFHPLKSGGWVVKKKENDEQYEQVFDENLDEILSAWKQVELLDLADFQHAVNLDSISDHPPMF